MGSPVRDLKRNGVGGEREKSPHHTLRSSFVDIFSLMISQLTDFFHPFFTLVLFFCFFFSFSYFFFLKPSQAQTLNQHTSPVPCYSEMESHPIGADQRTGRNGNNHHQQQITLMRGYYYYYEEALPIFFRNFLSMYGYIQQPKQK